jgi:hypothetical protein
VDVGLALAKIRRDRLYKEEYNSSEVYCREKWQYGRAYFDWLIFAVQVFNYLLTNSQQKPENESRIRPHRPCSRADLPVQPAIDAILFRLELGSLMPLFSFLSLQCCFPRLLQLRDSFHSDDSARMPSSRDDPAPASGRMRKE